MRARISISLALFAAALSAGVAAVPGLAQQPAALSPAALPPIDALAETVERPLFRPDRRPPSEAAVQQEIDDAETGLFSLVGIIVSPTQRIALVKVRGSQTVLQLSEGQQANGWTVLQINPGEVIFESKDKTETIELIDIKPPEPRRPAARDRRLRRPEQKTDQ